MLKKLQRVLSLPLLKIKDVSISSECSCLCCSKRNDVKSSHVENHSDDTDSDRASDAEHSGVEDDDIK